MRGLVVSKYEVEFIGTTEVALIEWNMLVERLQDLEKKGIQEIEHPVLCACTVEGEGLEKLQDELDFLCEEGDLSLESWDAFCEEYQKTVGTGDTGKRGKIEEILFWLKQKEKEKEKEIETKIVVLEGCDCVGKETQTQLLVENLRAQGKTVFTLSFPQYASPSSYFVKEYLKGAYPDDPDIAIYFYALDRYDTYQKKMKKKYGKVDYIVLDRYTTSSILCQISGLDASDRLRRGKIKRMEYEELSLPKPDKVIYLHLQGEKVIQELKKRRVETQTKGDLLESDFKRIQRIAEKGLDIAKEEKWLVIDCGSAEGRRSKQDISKEILSKVSRI